MTKLARNRMEQHSREDMVSLDRDLFNQLVWAKRELEGLRARTEDSERHIGIINKELAEIRGRLGIV